MEIENIKKDRIIYLDILRIIAAATVILLHVSASNWHNVDANTNTWLIFDFFDSISRFCVPIFVMISGALFLNKDISIKKIYTKYIFRIIAAFIFWSIIYGIFNFTQGIKLKEIVSQFFKGHYHMWYLIMIVGIYMITPITKKIVEDKNIMKYFLILSLVFAIIIPQIFVLFSAFKIKGNSILNYWWSNLNFHFALGYVGYFILGYYLNNKVSNKKDKLISCILMTIGFGSTFIISVICTRYFESITNFFDNLSINVLLESAGIFIFIKETFNKKVSLKMEKIIRKVSKNSFGVYLVHPLIIEILKFNFGITTLSWNPIISIIIITIVVTVISYIISAVLNSIPKVNKYIV